MGMSLSLTTLFPVGLRGAICGKMSLLWLGPYGSGELGRLGFKNWPVKPPPLPS
jgi:hypothetical protein